MLFPDGTSSSPLPLTRKELYYLGKFCEYGKVENSTEKEFFETWAEQRSCDWDIFVERNFGIRTAIYFRNSSKTHLVEEFQIRLSKPSLENALYFYRGAGRCQLPSIWLNVKTDFTTAADYLITNRPPGLVNDWEKDTPILSATFKLAEFYSLGLGCKKNEKLGQAYFQVWLSMVKECVDSGDLTARQDLFKYYYASPKENLNAITDFATKGDQDMIRLLVKTYHEMGEIRLRDYWSSRMIGPYYDPCR
ncbi:MAG: hypothetical protein IKW38_01435 [Kiritimatiellae bacterium]|nr:hypothetical protein [Kiritimatiellia bacterium]